MNTTTMTDDQLRDAAQEQYGSDDIEIDGANAAISRGDDPGAWVAAWVWVSFDE